MTIYSQDHPASEPITDIKEDYGHVKRMNRLYNVLSKINGFIIRVNSINELLESICPIIVDDGGFKFAWIGILDKETKEIRLAALWGEGEAYIRDLKFSVLPDLPGGTSPTGTAIRENRIVSSDDIEHDARMLNWRRRALSFGFKAYAAIPISMDNEVIGAVTLYADTPFTFGKEEIRLLEEIAGDISFAMGNTAKLLKAKYMLIFDPLTSLLTREHILQELQRLIESSSPSRERLTFIVMDIDRFKSINESRGYAKGDLLLKEISKRLASVIKPPNMLGRISADEFAVIGCDIKDDESIYRTIENINNAFSKPITTGSEEVLITFSMGISIYPDDGSTGEELIKLAEASLFQAKKLGTNSLVTYSPAINKRLSEIIKMKNKLIKSLENHEFIVYYEPKVNIQTNTLSGVEALLRWQDPEEGLVKPTRFVPILEETGMILKVGQWVLKEASKQVQKWNKKGYNLRLAVNISAAQMEQEDFASMIIMEIKDTGLNPSNLELEITESLLMKNVERNIEKILQVKDYGIAVSIDDFGTGYSSLAYLKRLPINTLKIDISFIKTLPDDKETAKIIETIISLAGVFNLKTIAEGIDSKEQINFLKKAGCDEVQGYYFTKPLPAKRFEEFMANFHRDFPDPAGSKF